MRSIGTVVRGVRAPIIRKGDDLVEITFQSVKKAVEENNIEIHDKDVVAVTEAVVGKAQGNFATLDQIAKDVESKFDGEVVGLINPILSRNRFSMLLRGIAKGVKKLVVQLSYPTDEVGNPFMPIDELDKYGVNPYTDSFTEAEFRKIFKDIHHPFTGLDYIEYYRSLSDNIEVVLSNNPRNILKYTDQVICADIHSRKRSKRILKEAGAKVVYGLDDILTSSVDGSGYNENYGLLGSNLSDDKTVKLFPRDCQSFVDALQKKFIEYYHKDVQCMIYGDGAFKDPVGGIWELADPVVSPAYTKGLEGTPNEIKLKYVADTQLKNINGEEAVKQMKELIKQKDSQLVGKMVSQGTTPRKITDLLGSLCDLTSGSGDKGTPLILIQGYFDNLATE